MERLLFSLLLLATAVVPGRCEDSAPAERKRPFHLELGGYFNNVDNGNGTWRGGDFSMRYSGIKQITPFASLSTQDRGQGPQQSYGAGSYIFFNKWVYSIVSASTAPDRSYVVFPRFRYDIMGLVKVPKVKGLVATTTFTRYQMRPATAEIVAVGGMYYYKKAVFTGGINFNRVEPGNHHSNSGQGSVMYGREKHYWAGGGMSGGRVAYPSVSALPFDLRYDSVGGYAFLRKWVGPNWGFVARYDYVKLIDAYQSNAVNLSLFFDF
jgi:YaiO family outer membrane protein